MSSEKPTLPTSLGSQTPSVPARKTKSSHRKAIPLFILLTLCGFWFPWDSVPTFRLGCHHAKHNHHWTPADLVAAKCPAQPPALNIGIDWNPLTDSAYAELAARRLSQAVQTNTESFDDLPTDPSDPKWDRQYAFAHMLEVEFPKVFEALQHEVVNTHAHLFTWEGKNTTLQPVILMAHIDTVPVLPATLGQWTFPPFEGRVVVNGTDNTPGTWVWGRGASDCKNALMSILGSVERLVTEGFTPDRTVILSFGFDEEVSWVNPLPP